MRRKATCSLLFALCTIAAVPAQQGLTAPYPKYPARPDKRAKVPAGFKEGPLRTDVVPGELLVDAPTLENLGFRWYIQGDTNRNASVAVSFRKKGDAAWRPALPLLRVHHEVVGMPRRMPWRSPNLFAGSVLSLTPGTTYEVRIEMTDPDGGAPPPRVLTLATRDVPQVPAGGRTLHVDPTGKAGRYQSIMDAFRAARPGDVIQLGAGTYKGPLRLRKSGEPGKPVVLRGAGDGESVLVAEGKAPLIDVVGANHLMFENLSLRASGTAIEGGRKHTAGSVGLVVRRCKIDFGGWCGINTGSEHSSGWYIADNVVTGPEKSWYPYKAIGKSTGINVYGQGHVVCHNRVTRVGDCLAVYNFGTPVKDMHKACVAIDFYNNDCFHAWDDILETDYGCHNIRAYRNRGYSANTGLSVQPFYGGPVYLIRNEIYNITSQTFKLNCTPAGIVAYNNTVCGSRWGTFASGFHNGHFRNNLILGGTSLAKPNPNEAANAHWAWAMIGGTLTAYSTFDHNGYGLNVPGRLIHWRGPEPPGSRGDYATVEAFAARSGHEKHGIQVDYSIFRKADRPERGVTYTPDQVDLRLQPGCRALDAGCVLPTVTDGYTGKAPDLGCHELGAPATRYGPRP